MGIWDFYAPFYARAMARDRAAYDRIYADVRGVAAGKSVLELATGPGALARAVAPVAAEIVATDFAPKMIAEARKGECPANLTFEVADAKALPYGDDRFDVVVIANALHVMTEPEQALREIRRVLKDDGVLIAPNFVDHRRNFGSRFRAALLRLGGVRFEHFWHSEEYLAFLTRNGWRIKKSAELPARIPLLYVECTPSE